MINVITISKNKLELHDFAIPSRSNGNQALSVGFVRSFYDQKSVQGYSLLNMQYAEWKELMILICTLNMQYAEWKELMILICTL